AAAGAGGNGQSWATAFQDLPSALAAVNAASCALDIWVAGGAYSTGGSSLTPGPHTAIYGGFVSGQSSLGQRDWQAHPTVISGSSVLAFFDGSVSAIGADTILDGLTFEGASSYAVETFDASPTIRNCAFLGNHQGAFVNNGAASFQNCSFLNNSGVADGAGIGSYGGATAVLGCVFSNHAATANGGALYAQTGGLTVTNSLLIDNSAPAGGGIGFGVASNVVVVNCTIADNSATLEG